MPMRFTLLLLIALLTYQTQPFSSASSAKAAEFDMRSLPCLKELNGHLNFDLGRTLTATRAGTLKLKFSHLNPLSINRAEDAYFLAIQARDAFKTKAPAFRLACAALAKKTHLELLSFFRLRLKYLLSIDELEKFHIEMNNALIPFQDVSASSDAFQIFLELETEFLTHLHFKLLRKLKKTSWEKYSAIQIRLQLWDPEWDRLMRREAPAAVEFSSHKIALRPLQYSPLELEIFLFHEIAHLAVQTGPAQPFENELEAWQETLRFVDALETSGQIIPDLFLNIRQGIRALGLRDWVRLVFESNLKPTQK